MKDLKTIIIALLIGISIFCVASYVSLLKEKKALQEEVRLRKIEVDDLHAQKQNLVQALGKEKIANEALLAKNSRLKQNSIFSSKRLNRLFTQYNYEAAQVSILMAENTALRKEKEKIVIDLKQAVSDRQSLQARLNSISELQKAIRDLKNKKRNGMLENHFEGNQGFLLKDGKTTYNTSVKIEVNPAASNYSQ